MGSLGKEKQVIHLSPKAAQLFEGKIPLYARSRGINLNRPSDEIDTLREALHHAYDNSTVSTTYPEKAMAAAIVVTRAKHDDGFCPSDWATTLLAQMYPQKIWCFNAPKWWLKKQYQKMIDTLHDNNTLVALAQAIFLNGH